MLIFFCFIISLHDSTLHSIEHATNDKKKMINKFVCCSSISKEKKRKELKDMKDMNFWLIKSRSLFSSSQSVVRCTREATRREREKRKFANCCSVEAQIFLHNHYPPRHENGLSRNFVFGEITFSKSAPIDRLLQLTFFLPFWLSARFLILSFTQNSKCIIKNL